MKELTDLNKRLDDIFKLFNIDGEFHLEGFDKGSEWYVLVAAGQLSYQYALGCLKVAQEFLKTRIEYFKSEEARIHFETAQGEEEPSEEAFTKYQEAYLNKMLDSKVDKIIEHIKETNGKTQPEMHSQLVIATTKLIKELGEGTEFHLSLNPPQYATEKGGVLEIDYKKFPQPKAVKAPAAKALPAKAEKPKENPEQ